MPRSRLTVPRALAAAVLVTAGIVGAAVVTGPTEEQPPAAYEPRSLGSIDTAAVAVPRAPFCDRVPPEAVELALGGEAESATDYGNGDAVRLGGRRDVAHEYGCVWRGADVEARAWVFAPPVTRAQADALAGAALRSPGCRELQPVAGFGEPSAGRTCTAAPRIRAGYRGLFGDAWLSCELTGRDAGEADRLAVRADRWCAAVVLAARAD